MNTMWTSILFGICAVILVRTAWNGFSRGAVGLVLGVLTLATAYGAAAAVGLNVRDAPIPAVPRLLQPFVLSALTGASVLALLTFLSGRLQRGWDRAAVERARAAGVEAPEQRTLRSARWNRGLGLVLGLVEGTLLAGGLLFFVHSVSLWSVASAPEPAPVTVQSNMVASEPGLRVSSVSDTPPPLTTAPAAAPLPPPPVDATPLHAALRSVEQELRRTPVAQVLDAVAPIKTRQIALAGRLTQLATDERHLKRFAEDQHVRRLSEHPRVVELSQDPEIARCLQEQRWTDLMNDSRILAIARDPSFIAEIRGLDLERLLGVVDVPDGVEHPTPERVTQAGGPGQER